MKSRVTDGQRVWFLMVHHPCGKVIRVGQAYSTRGQAASWRSFVRGGWRGCRVSIATLTLHANTDGTLTAATLRTLDRKFNLDAPEAPPCAR